MNKYEIPLLNNRTKCNYILMGFLPSYSPMLSTIESLCSLKAKFSADLETPCNIEQSKNKLTQILEDFPGFYSHKTELYEKYLARAPILKHIYVSMKTIFLLTYITSRQKSFDSLMASLL